jgi:type I restriction enzyme S subunit
MEIREGYKQTEVGLIPDDWNLEKFGDILTVSGGGAFKSSDSCVSGIKWLKISNVGINHTVWDNESYLPLKLVRDNENFLLKNGDYVIALTRPILDRKLKIARLGNDDVPALLNQRVGKIEIKQNNNIDFAYYLFQKHETISGLLESMAGTDPPNLSNRGIYSIDCAIPPTKSEQTAIATALSDADALTSSLEKLIDKKKAIKQGVIHKLLTGKERLSGYSGSWIAINFPEICWFQEGPGLRNWQFTDDGIKVINVTNLVDGYLNLDRTTRYISWTEFNKMYKHFEIDANDIVVASSGNSYAKVAVVRRQDLPLVMNTSVIRFKPLKNLDYNFLLAFLKSNYFKDQIDLLITGGAQPNFGPYHLRKIIIKIPPSMEEQVHIGQILKDIDTELEGLEQKLSKYKLLKQGMMQELLTGKIRLI